MRTFCSEGSKVWRIEDAGKEDIMAIAKDAASAALIAELLHADVPPPPAPIEKVEKVDPETNIKTEEVVNKLVAKVDRLETLIARIDRDLTHLETWRLTRAAEIE